MTQKHHLARHLVGLILLAAGFGKALNMPGFVQVLANYQLMPPWGNVVMAVTLPFIEMATGLGLLTANYLKAMSQLIVELASNVYQDVKRGINFESD